MKYFVMVLGLTLLGSSVAEARADTVRRKLSWLLSKVEASVLKTNGSMQRALIGAGIVATCLSSTGSVTYCKEKPSMVVKSLTAEQSKLDQDRIQTTKTPDAVPTLFDNTTLEESGKQSPETIAGIKAKIEHFHTLNYDDPTFDDVWHSVIYTLDDLILKIAMNYPYTSIDLDTLDSLRAKMFDLYSDKANKWAKEFRKQSLETIADIEAKIEHFHTLNYDDPTFDDVWRSVIYTLDDLMLKIAMNYPYTGIDLDTLDSLRTKMFDLYSDKANKWTKERD